MNAKNTEMCNFMILRNLCMYFMVLNLMHVTSIIHKPYISECIPWSLVLYKIKGTMVTIQPDWTKNYDYNGLIQHQIPVGWCNMIISVHSLILHWPHTYNTVYQIHSHKISCSFWNTSFCSTQDTICNCSKNVLVRLNYI